MAADRFSGKFFANGLHTGITLEHPGELGEKARKNLKEWAEENKGIDPAHRLTILEEGM
jgi:capsid portal protein